MDNYSHYDNRQQFLITLDIETNFPKGSYVRFLNDFFEEQISIYKFKAKRKNSKKGAPAKHAKMMLKIIFYAFSTGVFSMRELSEILKKDTDYIFLSGYQSVEHTTLSRFLNMYQEEIESIFSKVLYVLNNMGYVSSRFVAIDGCKIKANASKKFTGNTRTFEKKKITYEKMIGRLIERSQRLESQVLKKEINKKEAEREKKRIARLEKDYSNSLEKIENFLKEEENEEIKKHINLTDKDSVLLEKDKKYFQGYNCQAAVNANGIIIYNDALNTASDRGLLEEGVKKIEAEMKKSGLSEKKIKRTTFLADKGYNDSQSIGNLQRNSYNLLIPSKEFPSVDSVKSITSHQCILKKIGDKCILICPGKQRMEKTYTGRSHGCDFYIFYTKKKKCLACKYYSKCAGSIKNKKVFKVKKEVFDNLKEINKVKNKMKKPKYQDLYYKRFGSIEPTFGTITSNRGFSSFLVRGLDKVKLHWKLVCTAYNLRKMFMLQT